MICPLHEPSLHALLFPLVKVRRAQVLVWLLPYQQVYTIVTIVMPHSKRRSATRSNALPCCINSKGHGGDRIRVLCTRDAISLSATINYVPHLSGYLSSIEDLTRARKGLVTRVLVRFEGLRQGLQPHSNFAPAPTPWISKEWVPDETAVPISRLKHCEGKVLLRHVVGCAP